VEDTILEI